MKRISLIVYKRIKEYNRIYGKPCSKHAISKFKVSKTTLHRIATSKTYAEYLGKTKPIKSIMVSLAAKNLKFNYLKFAKKLNEASKTNKSKLTSEKSEYDLVQYVINELCEAQNALLRRVIALEAKNENQDSWFVKFIKKI